MAGYGNNDSPVEFGGYGVNDAQVDSAPKPAKRSTLDVVKDIGVTALKGAVGLPQAVVGIADIATGGRVGKTLEDAGYRPAETQKILDAKYSAPQQAANKAVREADGFVPTLKAAIDNPSAVATTIGESLPQMIGGAGIARGVMKGGAAIGTKVPAWLAGAAGEGVMGAGSAAETMRAESKDGLLTEKQALAAGGSGLGTAVLGGVGGKLAQRFGLGDVDTMLAQGGPQAAAAGAAKQGFLKQVAGSGLAEGAFEELPQSVQEQMWQNYANDKPLTDGVGNAAAMGLLAGTALGGIGGGYNALARQHGQTPSDQIPETPAISGLLTSPAATGTPSDQILTADVERANAVAAAQANADTLYQSRDEYEAEQRALNPEQPVVDSGAGIGALPQADLRQAMDTEAKVQLGTGALGRAASAGIDSGAIAAEQVLQPLTGVINGDTGTTAAGLAEKGGQGASDNGGQGVSDVLDTRVAPVGNGVGANAGWTVAGVQPDKPAANAPNGTDTVGPSAADMAAAARAPIGGPLSTSSGKNPQIDSNQQSGKSDTQPDLSSTGRAQAIARVGTTPKNAEDITVKDGVIYMGKYPAQHFETGEDITVGENADFAQVKKALQDGGALTSKQKVYPGVFGSKAKPDQPAAVVPSATSADITGNKIDGDWTEFGKSSGTLGISRADMPQIKAENRGAMVNFLAARGITSEQDEVSPDTLKATQKEFSRAKVEKAKGFTGNDRSILVSSDGYVLDGHHQWLAKRETGKPVKVIRLDAPIKTLLDDVKAFPSAQTGSGSTKPTSKLKAMIDARLASKEIRGLLPEFAKLSGWAERGGSILRDANTGEVTGRTKWIPRADWWEGKPSGVTERLIRSGVPKALNSQPITKLEREAVEWLLSVIEADIKEMNREHVAMANEFADDADDIPFDNLVGETDPRKQMEAMGFSDGEINEILEAEGRKADEVAARPAQESNQPGDETQATQASKSEVDRRQNTGLRKKISDMTPEEMRRELLVDAMTGLGNRRAYQESEKLATQVSIDADGLKWINDNLGHESGDRLLETIGKVIAEETTNGFHISGDEYVIQTHTKEEADVIMARVVERLNGVVIEGTTTSGADITLRGIGISYGINGDLNNAEKALREHKAQREREGLRGGRGAIPPNAIIGKQGGQDQQDNDSAEEEKPALELTGQTPAQIAAAEAASKKTAEKAARDDAKPTGPDVTADQVDLFNTQGGLFDRASELPRGGASVPTDASGANPLAESPPNAGAATTMTPGQSSESTIAPDADQGKPANTEDSGAELSYNLRNRRATGLKWEDLADKEAALRISEVTKAKVYPKPDYATLAEKTDPVTAHLLKQLYDSIATAPVPTRGLTLTDTHLQSYIAEVNRIMDAATAWAGKVSYTSQFRPEADGKSLLETVYPDGWQRSRAEVMLLGANRLIGALQPGRTEIARANKSIAKGWPSKIEAWQTQGFKLVESSAIKVRSSGVGDQHYVEVDGRYERSYPNKAEADAAIEGFAPWLLLNKRGSIVSQHDTQESALEAARAATKRDSKNPQVSDKGIAVTAAERVGNQHRLEGEDIDSDRLRSTFGFKGVNFGTWMKGKANEAERQLHLNHAYDSFMDLAEVLDVPPKAVSLNGMLGLAIGAQGRGGYAAHFVPGVNEINLTRGAGAGSLAHEFGHALDHYFARLGGLDREKTPFLTEHTGKPAGSDLRPEIMAKFQAIVKAMNTRPQTRPEYVAGLEKRIQTLTKNVDGWLKRIRRDFTEVPIQRVLPADAAIKREKALAKLDEISTRIRAGSVGDGKIAIGSRSSLSPAVAEIAELFKDTFGRKIGDTAGSLQSNVDALSSANERLNAAETHEPQLMVSTDYATNAAALDKGKSKAYWSTNLEKFARAFDAYVSDAMGAKAAKNTYLSHAGRTGETVPTGNERAAINQAFAELVSTIDTKETDTGTAMFQPDGSYDPYQTIEVRPNTTPKQLSAGREALASAEKRILGQNKEGFRLLGSNISADYRRNGGVSLIGQEVNGPEDLAFVAQVLRDPGFETFRVFFTDAAGKIVDERVYSSRLAGAVYLPENHAAQIHIDMRASGATGYWLLHNHPSGSAIESRADLNLTARIAKETPGFKGHVVLDHNEYNHISVENGIAKPKLVKAPQLMSIDLNANPEKPHPLLGEVISGPSVLAGIAKRLQTKDGYVVLIGTNAQQRISLLTEVPASYLKGIQGNKLKGLRAVAAIKRATGETGSTNLFAAVPGDVMDYGILIDSGILRDVVSMNGGESAASLGLMASNGIPVSNVARSGGKGYVAQRDEAVRPAQKQTETEAFKKWFGDSKVVDADGKPLVVYHGTAADFTEFDRNMSGAATEANWSLMGHFFTPDKALASSFTKGKKWPQRRAKPKLGGNVKPVYLSLQNPMLLPASRALPMSGSSEKVLALLAEAKANGHDGIIIEPFRKSFGLDDTTGELIEPQYIAFRSEQIKSSVGNNGQFDPSNPSIVEQPAAPYRDTVNKLRSTFGKPQTGPASQYAEQNRRIREEHIKTWDKAKKWMKRQLSPGGLLPDKVFAQKIERDSEFGAIELDVTHMVGALERAIKSDYKLSANDIGEKTERLLSDVMAGKLGQDVPEKTKTALLGMRHYIDGMTVEYLNVLEAQKQDLLTAASNGSPEAVREAAERASLMDTIAANVGRYVHRSYRAFDDKAWAKKVPDAVLDAARKYLMARYAEDGTVNAANRVEVILNEILKHGTAYENMEAFVKESKLGAKDLSVLKKREDIAPEIRALLGEYTDPRINFAKSATKMGRLIWNQRFLDRVRELGMGEFLFTDDTKPPEATVQIAGEKSDVYAPLNGLWVTPEVAQAFKDALGKEQMEDWYRTIVQINGFVKFGKTVLSPTTAARNWMSSFFFTVANGHFDMRHMRKSVAGFQEYFGNRSDGEKLAYLRELKQLGVVYDTPYAGEMMRLLADSEMADTLVYGKGKMKLKNALGYATKFYQYGDDFWKIIGYENEKQMFVDAGLSEQAAKVKAAERIRNTYPTYSMVGKGIQSLRRFPLAGTFVSFPAEIIRTSFNMVRYLAEDYKDPKMRPRAMKRAVGLAIASSFAYALQAASMAMLGYDDDDEEAIRQMAAPWQRNSNLLFTGRDEKGNLRFIDLSFLDPYNYWKRPIVAVTRGQPWREALKDVAGGALLPFFGVDILAGSIFDILANKKDTGGTVYREHDNIGSQVADIANHLRKAIQPGIAANMERTYKAMNGDVTKTGKTYDMTDEAFAWFGWRVSTLDPKVALFYRSFDFKDAKSQAEKHVRDALSEPKDVSEDSLRDSYGLTVRLRDQAYTDMGRLVEAAKESGMSRSEIVGVLKNSGVSGQDIMALMSGRVPTYKPTPQVAQNIAARARNTFGPEAAKQVMERYRSVRSYTSP